MTKPVLIEYPKSGERYAVVSAAAAAKHHPDARILSYEDGTPYEAPRPRPARKRPSRAKAKGTAAPAAAPVTETPAEDATNGPAE
jgi:hypothetical protein